MPNPLEEITIDQVKTPADEVFFLNQECVSTGLMTTLVTFAAGAVGIPLLIRSPHKKILFLPEYRLAFGTCASMVISYFAGVYVKTKCEEDLKKQLAEQLNS